MGSVNTPYTLDVLPKSEVMVLERPGYFGKHRAEKEQEYDQKYGLGGWSECWQVKDCIFNFHAAVMLYDDAYYFYLRDNPELITWCESFDECYDNDKSNVNCGTTHNTTSVPRHIQDVSVRRALLRLGTYFRGKGNGDNLLWIRSEDSNGWKLSPGNVPFHLPNIILSEKEGGPIRKWVQYNSVEEFWQRNKVIIATPTFFLNKLSVGISNEKAQADQD